MRIITLSNMARPKTSSPKVRVQFDVVERKLLAEMQANKPEYADLDLAQVARMELRHRLFEEKKKLKNEVGDRYVTALFRSIPSADFILEGGDLAVV